MLKAEHLRKKFTSVLAVDDITIEVQRGAIFGLIGPNGAGKSTTIRMLLNIIAPDAGTVTYDGKPLSSAMQNTIGYLPEERGLYRKNKVIDTMMYFAALKGVNGTKAKSEAMLWLKRFELETSAHRKVEELSKGNQQRLQFITSILHRPELIVLDEPFSGLDPVNQIVLKDILQELKQEGRAVIFSTHQMDSAEKLCDEICLINHGRIVLEGSLKEVKQRFGKNSVHLEYGGDGAFLSGLPFVKQATVYENYAELVLTKEIPAKEILQQITPNLELRKFEYVEPSLNSIFIEVVGVPQLMEEKERPLVVSPVSAPISASNDPRVKKSRLSLIFSSLITAVLIIISFQKNNPDWSIAGVMGAAVLFTGYRYIQTRKKVTLELLNRGKAENVGR
jgi:ABC-2 type transport system ATP-binding protein